MPLNAQLNAVGLADLGLHREHMLHVANKCRHLSEPFASHSKKVALLWRLGAKLNSAAGQVRVGENSISSTVFPSKQYLKYSVSFQNSISSTVSLLPTMRINSVCTYTYQYVPHKAVAEVSKIGNLSERFVVVSHG